MRIGFMMIKREKVLNDRCHPAPARDLPELSSILACSCKLPYVRIIPNCRSHRQGGMLYSSKKAANGFNTVCCGETTRKQRAATIWALEQAKRSIRSMSYHFEQRQRSSSSKLQNMPRVVSAPSLALHFRYRSVSPWLLHCTQPDRTRFLCGRKTKLFTSVLLCSRPAPLLYDRGEQSSMSEDMYRPIMETRE